MKQVEIYETESESASTGEPVEVHPGDPVNVPDGARVMVVPWNCTVIKYSELCDRVTGAFEFGRRFQRLENNNQ